MNRPNQLKLDAYRMLRVWNVHHGSKMQGPEVPHHFTPRVGEYDMWAIKYGYMAVEGEELLAEHEVSESYVCARVYSPRSPPPNPHDEVILVL